MPYQLPMPSTLEDIFKMNPGASQMAMKMLQGGMDQGDADLQSSNLRNMFDEQNNPLRLRQQQLANDSSEALLPGQRADSSMKQRKNQMEGELYNDTIKNALAEFKAKASERDVEELGRQGQRMAYSLDPTERKRGQQILSMHKDMIKEREKLAGLGANQLAGIRETGNQQRLTQQQAIDAGKYKGKGGAGSDIDAAAQSGKLNFEKAAVAFRVRADRALEDGDEEMAQRYSQRADQYEVAAQKQKQAAGQGVQRPDLPGLGMPAVGGQPPGPSFNTQAPAPASPEEAIKKALPPGVPYEPTKYDYRLNPQTGKVQYKPKG